MHGRLPPRGHAAVRVWGACMAQGVIRSTLHLRARSAAVSIAGYAL
jgi:hypothetical protein